MYAQKHLFKIETYLKIIYLRPVCTKCQNQRHNDATDKSRSRMVLQPFLEQLFFQWKLCC